MKQLDEGQLKELADFLEASLHRYEPLREELLDHLACLVEKHMHAGLSYPQAKARALACFSKDEVKSTEGHTLYFVHTKPVLMKIFSLISITFLWGLCSLSFWPSPESPPAAVPFTTDINQWQYPPDIAPVSKEFTVISDFGPRIHPTFRKKMHHRGVDFKAPAGTPIVATADGTVQFAAEDGKYGLKIVIRHDEQYQSLYAHLSEIKIKAGDKIEKGTVIGLVGNTGVSAGPHLHYEILKDGQAVNPADYLPKS